MHRYCDNSNPAPYPKWVIPGVIESTTCLLPLVTAFSENNLKLYPHFKNSLMPYSGGLLDQPAIFLEAMQVIEKSITDE